MLCSTCAFRIVWLCLNPDLKTKICSSSQLAGVGFIKAKWDFSVLRLISCFCFADAVSVAGFMNSTLAFSSGTSYLIIGCCTKKTQQTPSNLPPSSLQFLHLHSQPFRRLQRVLSCKAANHLLTGPLIIADFIPPACLLVSNRLFYTQNELCLLLGLLTAGRGGDFRCLSVSYCSAEDPQIVHSTSRHLSTAQCGGTDVRRGILSVKSSILLVLLCSSPKAWEPPYRTHLWKPSSEMHWLWEGNRFCFPCSSSVQFPKMPLQSTHDAASTYQLRANCQVTRPRLIKHHFSHFFFFVAHGSRGRKASVGRWGRGARGAEREEDEGNAALFLFCLITV